MLVESVGHPLTEREREVAALAVRGMTSKEIATELFVGVRTVDNHLGRLYAKLGVEGRTALIHLVPTHV